MQTFDYIYSTPKLRRKIHIKSRLLFNEKPKVLFKENSEYGDVGQVSSGCYSKNVNNDDDNEQQQNVAQDQFNVNFSKIEKSPGKLIHLKTTIVKKKTRK